MRLEDIWMASAPGLNKSCTSFCLTDGEILNTSVYWHCFEKRRLLRLPANEGYMRVLLLYAGEARFVCNGCLEGFSELAVVVPVPRASVEIRAEVSTQILEMKWELTPAEFGALPETETGFLLAKRYREAEQYREDCKSEKTTSRILVPPRIIPRFAMGSVETRDDDRIEKHMHPMLEQYFFGLSQNDCELLVGDLSVPFGRSVLVHIPLGSEHGIKSSDGQVVQYIWMDFLFDDTGLEYLDSTHKIIK